MYITITNNTDTGRIEIMQENKKSSIGSAGCYLDSFSFFACYIPQANILQL